MQVNYALNCQFTHPKERHSTAIPSLSTRIALAVAGLISTTLIAVGAIGAVLFNPIANLTLVLVGIVSLVMLFIVTRMAKQSGMSSNQKRSSQRLQTNYKTDSCTCNSCSLLQQCEEGTLPKSEDSPIGADRYIVEIINEHADNRPVCPSVIIEIPETDDSHHRDTCCFISEV